MPTPPWDRLTSALAQGRLESSTPAGRPAASRPGWSAAFERLYFEAAERHLVETGRAARAYAEAGHIDLPPGVRRRMGKAVRSTLVDEGEVLGVIMAARNVAGERLDRSSAAVLPSARSWPITPGRLPGNSPAWIGMSTCRRRSADPPRSCASTGCQLIRKPWGLTCGASPA
jgi:hypothetical protein